MYKFTGTSLKERSRFNLPLGKLKVHPLSLMTGDLDVIT